MDHCVVYEPGGKQCERGPVVGNIPGIGQVCAYHGRNQPLLRTSWPHRDVLDNGESSPCEILKRRNMAKETRTPRVLRIEGAVQGQTFRHIITLHYPDSGGMNPLSGRGEIMAYGCRQDSDESEPTWHHYPDANVICYSVVHK